MFELTEKNSELYNKINDFIDRVKQETEKIVFIEVDLNFTGEDLRNNAKNLFTLSYNERPLLLFVNNKYEVKVGFGTFILTINECSRVNYLVNEIQNIVSRFNELENKDKLRRAFMRSIYDLVEEEGGFYD